jgi:small-conductance mechanosensitive channel
VELINSAIAGLKDLIPALATIAIILAGLGFLNRVLKRRWRTNPDAQFRLQMIMLTMSLAGFIAVIVTLPISNALRGQLLSLIGILLSAAIALSSTTFIGNIMAGIMLRSIRSARPGDFITVAELTGRITEMGLLHTEIQTEFRDLVTVPNLYMVTNPLKVVRASGTIITEEVSLGYDVPQGEATRVLVEAAKNAGLQDGFAQVRKLGDYSVTYRVAGLLEDVKSLISSRSSLRAAMLDGLHHANIEIVSPSFMNTRAVSDKRQFIPRRAKKAKKSSSKQVEELAFDKAESAASVEEIRTAIEVLDADFENLLAGDESVDASAVENLKAQRAQLTEQLTEAEERHLAEKRAEQARTPKPESP